MAQHTLEESRADLEDAMASFLKTMQHVVDNEDKYQRLLLDVVATMLRIESKVDLHLQANTKEEVINDSHQH